MSPRGLSPIVGVVSLLAVTVVLSTVVGLSVPTATISEPTTASFEGTAEPNGEIRITHHAGDPIDPEDLDVRIDIDDEALAEQPPVPFFSASGFRSAPGGAFNSASSEHWTVGETASLRVAETNTPSIKPGDTVAVQLSIGGDSTVTIEMTA